ncbi:hypothetical protein AAP_06218 [Ascosphaera apis ARSEF 7405]|uniref:Uncharacterized protein n=1 Tax=Ascosphaera apis ARSEF 7405 TaxID=392613 RepID=A0A167UZH6_9EURO|nr:hypothetical protein AAP_06218 [Ascosphaera apis ARSEF 7405]
MSTNMSSSPKHRPGTWEVFPRNRSDSSFSRSNVDVSELKAMQKNIMTASHREKFTKRDVSLDSLVEEIETFRRSIRTDAIFGSIKYRSSLRIDSWTPSIKWCAQIPQC